MEIDRRNLSNKVPPFQSSLLRRLKLFFDLEKEEILSLTDEWKKLLFSHLDVKIEKAWIKEKSSTFVERYIVELLETNSEVIVDFVAEPFPKVFPKEIRKTDSGVIFRTDSLTAIALKKFWTFHTSAIQKILPRPKDVVDFYKLSEVVDFVSLFETYETIFPEVSIEALLSFVRSSVRSLDYSQILDLKIDLKEMFDFYEKEFVEICFKALYQNLDRDKVKSKSFKFRYLEP